MTPEEVGKSYDQIADLWSSSTFDSSNGIGPLKKAITFIKDRKWALDVGCGCNGRFFDLLLAESFQAEGLDVSAEMVRRARERHPQIRFHHSDFTRWTFPRSYDLIIAWDSLWHLPLSDQEDALIKLCDGLSDNGVLLLSMGGLNSASETRNTHMGVPLSYSTLGIPKTRKVIAENGCICRYEEFDQAPETHFYFIAQRTN